MGALLHCPAKKKKEISKAMYVKSYVISSFRSILARQFFLRTILPNNNSSQSSTNPGTNLPHIILPRTIFSRTTTKNISSMALKLNSLAYSYSVLYPFWQFFKRSKKQVFSETILMIA
jgi:hypothetical protein